MPDALSPWVRTSTGDLLSADGRWRVRQAPCFRVGKATGKVMRFWWLYHRGQRFTPTGRFNDAVSFCTPLAAKLFAQAQHDVMKAKEKA